MKNWGCDTRWWSRWTHAACEWRPALPKARPGPEREPASGGSESRKMRSWLPASDPCESGRQARTAIRSYHGYGPGPESGAGYSVRSRSFPDPRCVRRSRPGASYDYEVLARRSCLNTFTHRLATSSGRGGRPWSPWTTSLSLSEGPQRRGSSSDRNTTTAGVPTAAAMWLERSRSRGEDPHGTAPRQTRPTRGAATRSARSVLPVQDSWEDESCHPVRERPGTRWGHRCSSVSWSRSTRASAIVFRA